MATLPGAFRGYFKREGRPTEREIVTSRLIDRPLRPLFTEGFDSETQIIALVMSADKHNDPDVLAITGASAALYISDIPFETPIAGVRVGLVDGKLVINPTYQEMRASSLNLTVAGSEEAIVMVEAGAKEVSEEVMVEALLFGHSEIKRLCAMQRELRARVGKPKRPVTPVTLDEAILQSITADYTDRLRAALDVRGRDKLTSYAEVDALEKEVIERYPADAPDQRAMARRVFEYLKEKSFGRTSCSTAGVPTGASFRKSGPSRLKWGYCPGRTGAPCLPVAKPRPLSRPPWAQARMCSIWTIWKPAKSSGTSCSTTIFSRSAWVKLGGWAAPDGGKSVTARWRTGPCRLSCQRMISPM